MDRWERFLSDFPAGNPYQNLAYFAQTTVNEDWYRFDYGRFGNKSHYGQNTAPLVPIEDFDLPTLIISGSSDRLADPTDVAWLEEKIAKNIVYSQQYNLGHLSFTLAKDMTWFKHDVMDMVDQYATNVYQSEIL